MALNPRYGLAICAWSIAVVATAAQPRVNPKAAMMKEFRDRADAYLALHQKVADKLPPLKETSDAQKIAEREHLLGVTIGRARPAARSGEIFGAVAPLVASIVREDISHRSSADRKALFSVADQYHLSVDGAADHVSTGAPAVAAAASRGPRVPLLRPSPDSARREGEHRRGHASEHRSGVRWPCRADL